MFDVVLLACHLMIPNQCLQIDNTRGPYPTIEQCHIRMLEMSIATKDVFRRNNQPYVIIKRECRPLDGSVARSSVTNGLRIDVFSS
jgi:hypothetical protein